MRDEKSLDFINKSIVCALVFLACHAVGFAQSADLRNYGEVSLTIKLSAASDLNDGAYEVSVLGSKRRLKVVHERRSIEKIENPDVSNGEDNKNQEIKDLYRLRVSPGIYRIVIKKYEGFRFANFKVVRGETTRIQILEDQFAWDTICYDDLLILKTFDNLEPRNRQENRYRSPPYRRVSADRFLLRSPFEIVARYCRKTSTGTKIHYKSAVVYYQTFVIEAENIAIDKTELVLEAIGSEEYPVKILRGADGPQVFRSVKIDLRSLRMSEEKLVEQGNSDVRGKQLDLVLENNPVAQR